MNAFSPSRSVSRLSAKTQRSLLSPNKPPESISNFNDPPLYFPQFSSNRPLPFALTPSRGNSEIRVSSRSRWGSIRRKIRTSVREKRKGERLRERGGCRVFEVLSVGQPLLASNRSKATRPRWPPRVVSPLPLFHPLSSLCLMQSIRVHLDRGIVKARARYTALYAAAAASPWKIVCYTSARPPARPALRVYLEMTLVA